MKNTLLLVDGSSYLYRAFYAMPDLRGPQGQPTGALRGIINMLQSLEQQVPASYCACVFDAKGSTFREAIYPEYKAHRPPMPDDLRAQIEPIHQVVAALGWPILCVEGVEADDVIGTLAHQAGQAGWEVVISTGDKDMAQLVNSQVRLVNTMTNEWLDVAGVTEKFGVPPERIVDYLTLIGDSVDNVPGVNKVGPKTAVKWLQQYGSLAQVVAQAEQISGAVGGHLRAALDWLPTAQSLLQIRLDVADLPELSQLARQPRQAAVLTDLYQNHGFRGLLQNLSAQASVPTSGTETAVAMAAPAPSAPQAAAVAAQVETITELSALQAWIPRLLAAPLVALDTETTGLDPFAARLVGLSWSITPGQAVYVPLAHRGLGVAQCPMAEALALLQPWLESPHCLKVGQNLKFDQHMLANHGLQLRGIAHDTMLASYVQQSHLRHNLDALIERHLGHAPALTFEMVCGKGAKQISFADVDVELASRYAGEDADCTLQVHLQQEQAWVGEPSLQALYTELELPVAQVLWQMERTGILIDSRRLLEQSQRLGERLQALEREAYALVGQPFNLNSPKQLQDVLFNQLALTAPGLKKTASGGYSTDEEALEKLAPIHPLPQILLEYRGLAKLKSTYTDKLPQMARPDTGRVHTQFAQAVAVTGRLSSSDPNLQNIPIRTEEGRLIRTAFIAPEDHVLVAADYSQIELRIMAHLSDDPGLLAAFASGADVHRRTAAEVFAVPEAEVTADQRRYAKTINFGLIYGMSAFGLAAQMGVERAQAQSYIQRYFERYPGVQQFMHNTRAQAVERGYVETVFGRRLHLPDLKNSNAMRRQAAERAAINAPMQGTAADLIKRAMLAVQGWIVQQQLNTRLLLQVHDELVLEVPQAELAQVQAALPKLMTQVAELKVPLEVSLGVGQNWGEAH